MLYLKPFGQEAITVNLSNFIITLNDLLLKTPVLVQAFHATDEKLHQIKVSFPIEREEGENIPVIEDEGKMLNAYSFIADYNEHNIVYHPTLYKLEEHICLTQSVGYVTMHLLNDHQGIRWVPIDITYGIPLGSTKLSREIFQKIESMELLAKANLEDYGKSSRLLSLNFLKFIEYNGGLDPTQQGIPYPSKIVSFEST